LKESFWASSVRVSEGSEEAFFDFPDLLHPGDLLVLNDTRVIRARLYGRKETGGKAEILLDRPLGPSWQEDGYTCQSWTCLLHASRPLKTGGKIFLPGGGQAIRKKNESSHSLQVLLRLPQPVMDYLEVYGAMPLPAYIRRSTGDIRKDMDPDRYQTVYAKIPGAVAAPTAGLHFTQDILDHICSRGIDIRFLTLHVGPGTFLPVRTQNIDQHIIHREVYHIGSDLAQAIAKTRSVKRRVVAVGTTVVRALETAWNGVQLRVGPGETDLFIRPVFEFKVVDALLTNFHLPRSTLLMLVCAFYNTERILWAYGQAVEKRYRFYSYGDAMFIA